MPTVAELAARIGGTLDGNGEIEITGVSGLREAVPGQISYLGDSKYLRHAESSRASAVIVREGFEGMLDKVLVRVEEPEMCFYRVAQVFAPPPRSRPPGIHASAVIDPSATLGDGVSIGPLVVIEEEARIGADTVIEAQCFVGAGTVVGENCHFHPQVAVREDCIIGNRVILQVGAKIGSDGFGYRVDAKGAREKIPQIGIVLIDDDVEVGANSTIDRARFGRTVIGRGVKIDNLVQVAHNVVLGEHCVLVAQVGIAGSVLVGKRVIFGGHSAVAGHLQIGDDVLIGGKAGVTKDLSGGEYYYGFPAQPFRDASRIQAHVQNLPRLQKKLGQLQERLDRLES